MLVGHVLGSPSVARYGFTTSTLPRPTDPSATVVPPDEAGTHCLNGHLPCGPRTSRAGLLEPDPLDKAPF